MNPDALADWVQQRDHFGTLQPASIEHVDSIRITTEWTDMEIEFPPAPAPPLRRCKRAASREAHLHEWLAALRSRDCTDPYLVRYVELELGIEPEPYSPMRYRSGGPAEVIEWEEGDFIPPAWAGYKDTAEAMPRQVDAMHWLTVMRFLCGLDDDLSDRLAVLRQTFLRVP